MNRAAWVALAAVALVAGCAGYNRLTTYPVKLADAKVSVGGWGYSVWFHRVDKTIVVQRGAVALTGETLVSLPGMQITQPQPIWRAAAERVLVEFGCKAVEVYRLDDTAYEARYECPDQRRIDEPEIAPKRAAMRAGLSTPNPLAPGGGS